MIECTTKREWRGRQSTGSLKLWPKARWVREERRGEEIKLFVEVGMRDWGRRSAGSLQAYQKTR